MNQLDEEFLNAKRSQFSVIILDELDSLVGADAELRGYNNVLRLKYEALLKNAVNSANKCIVIATASSLEFMERLKLAPLFNEIQQVPLVQLNKLNSRETLDLLQKLCIPMGYTIKASTVSVDDKRQINMPIRDLIYQIEKYCSQPANNQILDVDAFYNSLPKSLNPVGSDTPSVSLLKQAGTMFKP